jgi:hypothetical protein
VELFDSVGKELGIEGLKHFVLDQTSGCLGATLHLIDLEQQLLRFCNEIHPPDDLTLLKLRRTPPPPPTA